jgi:hypothetical protein
MKFRRSGPAGLLRHGRFVAGALLRNPRALMRFIADWRRYQAAQPPAAFAVRADALWPIFADYDAKAGVVDDYFHQDLWAARRIYAARPASHVDIGSRVDGFVAHVLTFMPVTYVDIRPLPGVRGLDVVTGDATRLDMFSSGSLESVSSLSVAEHFGLGRYSDPIDPSACFVFMRSLARVLAPAGRLYFSVPIGIERVEFNAHRVFALATVLGAFEDLRLASFSYIDGSNTLHEDIPPSAFPEDTPYSTGLFEFTR